MTVPVGIVGCGGVSRHHLEATATLPGYELVGVADLEPERAAAVAASNGCPAYDSVTSLLRQARPQAVVVCVATPAHYRVAVAAIEAGCDILIEKPIAATVEQAQALLHQARRRRRVVSVVSQKRFHADFHWLTSRVREGRFGKPVLAAIRSVWRRNQDYYLSRAAQADGDHSGLGALLMQGIHYVDIALWQLGSVSRVSGMRATTTHDIDVEDNCVASLQFANGCLATLAVTTSAFHQPDDPETLSIEFERARVSFSSGRLVHLDCAAGIADGMCAPATSGRDRETKADLFLRQHEDFQRAIATRSTPFVSGEDGLAALEIVQRIYASCQEPRAIFADRRSPGVGQPGSPIVGPHLSPHPVLPVDSVQPRV